MGMIGRLEDISRLGYIDNIGSISKIDNMGKMKNVRKKREQKQIASTLLDTLSISLASQAIEQHQ